MYNQHHYHHHQYTNTLTWTVSVRLSVRHGRESVMDVTHQHAISFLHFELHTGYVSGTRAPRIFRSVQLAHSALDHLTQTNTNSERQLACGHTCAPTRESMNPTQYLGRIAWRPWTTIGLLYSVQSHVHVLPAVLGKVLCSSGVN